MAYVNDDATVAAHQRPGRQPFFQFRNLLRRLKITVSILLVLIMLVSPHMSVYAGVAADGPATMLSALSKSTDSSVAPLDGEADEEAEADSDTQSESPVLEETQTPEAPADASGSGTEDLPDANTPGSLEAPAPEADEPAEQEAPTDVLGAGLETAEIEDDAALVRPKKRATLRGISVRLEIIPRKWMAKKSMTFGA